MSSDEDRDATAKVLDRGSIFEILERITVTDRLFARGPGTVGHAFVLGPLGGRRMHAIAAIGELSSGEPVRAMFHRMTVIIAPTAPPMTEKLGCFIAPEIPNPLLRVHFGVREEGWPGLLVEEADASVMTLFTRLRQVPKGDPVLYVGVQRQKRSAEKCATNSEGLTVELPRGFKDPTDAGYLATALREFREEQSELDQAELERRARGSVLTLPIGTVNSAYMRYGERADGTLGGVQGFARELSPDCFDLTSGIPVFLSELARKAGAVVTKDEAEKMSKLEFIPVQDVSRRTRCFLTRLVSAELVLELVRRQGLSF